MKYIKARYESSKKDYNFRCDDDSVKVGDIVTPDGKKKLTVTGDSSQSWLNQYGHGKIADVHRYVERGKTNEML